MTLNDLYNNVKKRVGDYFAPTQEVRARDIIREVPNAVGTTFNRLKTGRLGEGISRDLEQFDYFKPTENVRVRDFIRETPMGIDKSMQGLAQSVARFGISLAELPSTFSTGRATGQFYNTPVGRLNSFQSEAQNRVNRGDPLWKAIGNPALDTILAGADVAAITKPLLSTAKNFNHFGKVGDEIRAIAGDLTMPLNKATLLGSKTLSIRPGLTIDDTMKNPANRIFQESIEGMKKQYEGIDIMKDGILNPKLVQGRIDDVAQKIARENGDDAAKTFRQLFENKSFKSYDEFADDVAKGINQIFTGGFKSKTLNIRPGMTIKATGSGPDKPQLPNEVKKILTGNGKIKERGFITHIKESNSPAELKKTVEGVYTPKSGKELKAAAKKLIMENIVEAEQRALNPSSDVDVQIGNELINHFAATGDFTKAKAISEGMANSGTDFGRAVQAFANYDKTTPDGALKFAQSTINKYNKINPTKKLEITNDQVKALFERAAKIQEMPEGEARNIASGQLVEEIHNLIPSTFGDKAVAVWKAGLLTSLRTHERNLIGNTVHAGAEIGKDVLASPIDSLMALRTGQRTKTFTVRGLGEGGKKGVIAGKNMIKYGFDPEEAISKYDFRHVTWGNNKVEQALKKYTDAVFRTLGAEDKVFYHSAFARSLYDQAGAQAINAGKAGNKAFIDDLVKNATEQMKMVATQDASISVFKDRNKLTQIATAFKQKGGPLAEIVAPFTGVPSSIAGQIINYSPVGLAKGLYKGGKVMIKNLPTLQRQASEEISRGIVGTGIMGLAAYLTGKGLMTGNPKDAAESRQWQLEGKMPNSILIGGKWRSINSVGPEALVMLAGSKIKTSENVSQAAGNIGKDFMGQTFLQGVQQPLNAITDPARYGGSYLRSQAGSLTPNIVKDAASAFDPKVRETNSALDNLKYGIPGARNTLLPSKNALGEDLKNERTGWRSFVDLFNSRTPISNPLVDELSRLNVVDQNATPSKMDKKQTILGEKVELTPAQLDQIEEQSGNLLRPALEKLVTSPSYQKLSDEKKKAMIQNVVADIRDNVKKGFKTGQPIGTKSINDKTNENFVNLADGKVYVPELDRTFKSPEEADFVVKKQEFADSDKNIQIVGNKVLRKGEDGSIYTQSKNKYDVQIIGQKMERAKKNEDLDSWFKQAEEKFQKLQEQLNDPNTDDLEKETIQNDIDDLITLYQKYRGYGGFTKPKKGKSAAADKKLKVNLGSLKSIKFGDVDLPEIKSPKIGSTNVPKPDTIKIRAPRVSVKKINLKRSISTIPGAKRLA